MSAPESAGIDRGHRGPRWNPSATYRMLYIAVSGGSAVGVILLTGNAAAGLLAAGCCSLAATCAALATEWDHRGWEPRTTVTSPAGRSES